jgi:hypothetical protein
MAPATSSTLAPAFIHRIEGKALRPSFVGIFAGRNGFGRIGVKLDPIYEA